MWLSCILFTCLRQSRLKASVRFLASLSWASRHLDQCRSCFATGIACHASQLTRPDILDRPANAGWSAVILSDKLAVRCYCSNDNFSAALPTSAIKAPVGSGQLPPDIAALPDLVSPLACVRKTSHAEIPPRRSIRNTWWLLSRLRRICRRNGHCSARQSPHFSSRGRLASFSNSKRQ